MRRSTAIKTIASSAMIGRYRNVLPRFDRRSNRSAGHPRTRARGPCGKAQAHAASCGRGAAHLRRNPGEMAFPGGLVDPGEDEPATTALREFEEELGLSRGRVRIVERLGDVVTRALSVTVTPFV